MKNLKIAAACMHSTPGEVDKNLDKIRVIASEASAKGANIVCFPELSVTGYIQGSPGGVYKTEDVEKIVDQLVRMAREMRLVLIAGLIEIVSEGGPYITQAITGPDGLIGLYRKTHLAPTETGDYSPGQKIELYRYGNTTFGVQLCYEAHFPEISTTMALMGADILFVPHASPRGDPEGKLQSWLRHLPARAFDNGLFVVACNQVGKTGEGLSFPGVAVVLGPDGRVLDKYVGEDDYLLFAELEVEMLRDVRKHRMRYFLPGRRPELYKKR
ncbi:MAG: nitrilase [Desulfobacteraceae bacterium]|nr:nitrilase [Desulfobacteraceae bacterium]